MPRSEISGSFFVFCYIAFVLKSILFGVTIAATAFVVVCLFSFHESSFFLIPVFLVCAFQSVDSISKGLLLLST